MRVKFESLLSFRLCCALATVLSAIAASFRGVAAERPAVEAAPAAESAPSGCAPSALLAEINVARTDPRGYAKILRDGLTHFHDLTYEAPDGDALETVEGVTALKDAIADLEARKPAPPLAADRAIAQAALRLVEDQGRTGASGHVDSRNASLRDRLEAAGVTASSMEETIAYGPTDPREVVRELIIDDGIADRAHRNAIFDSAMTRAGCACGPHTAWGWVCVIDFASDAMADR
jgi:uncharacterized protein YkwD